MLGALVGERSEQRRGWASEASGGGGVGERSERGGAAGRPRIVAEGDVLRVVHKLPIPNYSYIFIERI